MFSYNGRNVNHLWYLKWVYITVKQNCTYLEVQLQNWTTLERHCINMLLCKMKLENDAVTGTTKIFLTAHT